MEINRQIICTWVMVHGKLLSYQKPNKQVETLGYASVSVWGVPLLVLYDLHVQYVQRGCIQNNRLTILSIAIDPVLFIYKLV